MKNKKHLLAIIIIVAILSFFVSCSDMMLDLQKGILEVHIDTSLFVGIDGTLYTVTATQRGARALSNPISTTESFLIIKPVNIGTYDILVQVSIEGEIVGEGSSVVRVSVGTTSTNPILINQEKSLLTHLSFNVPPTGLSFNPSIYQYPNLSNEFGISAITVNASSSGSILVNSNDVASGDDSHPIDLHVGENVIRVVVKELGKAAQEYTFTVTRLSSSVGALGEAGGYTFYDKGEVSDGWRYLEAAPFDWAGDDEDPKFEWTQANEECAALSIEHLGDTYDDWYLPSKEELQLIYENLFKEGRGGFSDEGYWSSSVSGPGTAYYQVFIEEGLALISNCQTNEFMVRPIRAFSGE